MIIILNGPPRSGKDTVAALIRRKLVGTKDYKMSMPLKACFRAMFNFPNEINQRMLEKDKEKPILQGHALTPRQFQIDLSEEFMKKRFGSDIFGQLAVRNIDKTPSHHITISDVGFMAELWPIIETFGTSVRAIQISRPGTNYDNDSRSDLDFDVLGIEWAELINENDMDMLDAQVERQLRKWELFASI